MEMIRWLLATAGVEFEEAEYLETRKQYEKIIQVCKCFNAVTSISIPEASADKKAKKMHSR
ncbi:unnamed protein product [Natator depressus]